MLNKTQNEPRLHDRLCLFPTEEATRLAGAVEEGGKKRKEKEEEKEGEKEEEEEGEMKEGADGSEAELRSSSDASKHVHCQKHYHVE